MAVSHEEKISLDPILGYFYSWENMNNKEKNDNTIMNRMLLIYYLKKQNKQEIPLKMIIG